MNRYYVVLHEGPSVSCYNVAAEDTHTAGKVAVKEKGGKVTHVIQMEEGYTGGKVLELRYTAHTWVERPEIILEVYPDTTWGDLTSELTRTLRDAYDLPVREALDLADDALDYVQLKMEARHWDADTYPFHLSDYTYDTNRYYRAELPDDSVFLIDFEKREVVNKTSMPRREAVTLAKAHHLVIGFHAKLVDNAMVLNPIPQLGH